MANNHQKQPGRPKTVLVKPHIFINMSMALWRNDDFCIMKNPKFWIHFLDVFAFYHSASSFSSAHLTFGIFNLFLRRCVSKSPKFSSANWHESWCTSLANFCSKASSRGCEKTNFLECNLLMLTMLRGGTEKKNDRVLEVRRRSIAWWKFQEER